MNPIAQTTALPASIAAFPRLPTESEIADAVQHLEGIRLLLAAYGTATTMKDRTHFLRFRKGGEPIASLMVALTNQYKLQMPGIDTPNIQQNLALVQRLQPLETKMRVVDGMLSSTLIAAKSVVWRGTTSLYKALARSAVYHGDLESELRPAVAFFKRTKAKAEPAPTTDAKKAADTALPKTELPKTEAANGASSPPPTAPANPS